MVFTPNLDGVQCVQAGGVHGENLLHIGWSSGIRQGLKVVRIRSQRLASKDFVDILY